MITYKFSKSVSDALDIPFIESIELSDQMLIDSDRTYELATGWNNCKTWKIAIRESMNDFYSSPEAVNVAILKRESMKRYGKNKNSGFTNYSHSLETKKKCSQAARKYMTHQEIELMFSLYDEGYGHKSIAKKIGYSASSIRKRINRSRQLG